MEQMANLQVVPAGDDEPERTSPWRSFGSVASALLARAEAQRALAAPSEEAPFMTVAWAAE